MNAIVVAASDKTTVADVAVPVGCVVLGVLLGLIIDSARGWRDRKASARRFAWTLT